MVALFGRRILRKALATCLNVLLGLILLACFLNGSCWLTLFLRVLLDAYLMSLMSGLMVALFKIRSQVFHLWGRVFSLVFLVSFGMNGGGAILMTMLVEKGPTDLAVVTVLFLVLCRLCREQSSWVSFLLVVFTLVRTIWVLCVNGNVGSCPAELVKDGDLVLLIGRILEIRGRRV